LQNSPDSVLHRVASRHLLPERKLASKSAPSPIGRESAGLAAPKPEAKAELVAPKPRVKAEVRATPIKLAATEPKAKGVAADFTMVTSQTNFTFQSDTTYYVSSNVTLSGTTVFEGGTVIKFTNSTSAKLNFLDAGLVCKTGP